MEQDSPEIVLDDDIFRPEPPIVRELTNPEKEKKRKQQIEEKLLLKTH